jgi:Zinc dependent phospholipase C
MAAPYVHCLVSREALKNIFSNKLFFQHRNITNPAEDAAYFPYVCLGSVSPDYPYPAASALAEVNTRKDDNDWTWGDKFHKEKTGAFIDIGIQELRDDVAQGRFASDAFKKKAAWLMGYYSHIITDLVVHAVVYKLVDGCYERRGPAHLHCEVTQDSLLFYDVYSDPKKELVDVKFLKILEKCNGNSGPIDIMDDPSAPINTLNPDIKSFWNRILNKNYSIFYKTEEPKIDNWHDAYLLLMKDATKALARGIEPGKAYHRTTDIATNAPEEKKKYYSDMTLPDGTTGNYKDKVFNKAVDEVTKGLKDFLNALDNTVSYLALSKSLIDWNLDKGTISGYNPKFALWDGQAEHLFDCPGDPPKKTT